MDTLKQDRPLRLKILSLLLDPRWISIYGRVVIKPEFFETEEEMAFATAVHTYYEAYNKPPTDPDDIVELMELEDSGDFVYEVFDEYIDKDTSLVSDLVIQFAREQAAKLAIIESVDDVKRGNLSKILQRIEAAVKVGESISMPGIDVVADVDKWLYEYWTEKVRTPWTHVNTILGGGVAAEELGIILAPTNVGKTMALVDIGYSAASIGSGVNVVHFTHELKAESVSRRYAARMMFKFLNRGESVEGYKEDFINAAKKLMPGNVRIIGGARKMKVSEMRSHLDRLNAEGFEIGLIIDDYPDLLVPDVFGKEHRFDLSNNYRELRAMSGEYEAPVWGASQSTRGSYNKEIITVDDIAEDIGKAQIADIIIAVCQTKEEYDMERCRLFLAKVREGKRNYLFDAKYYSDSQAIITTGMTKKKEQDV